MRVYIERAMNQDTTNFYFMVDRPDGRVFIIAPMNVTLVPWEEGSTVEPSLSIHRTVDSTLRNSFLQQMADAIADMGIFPGGTKEHEEGWKMEKTAISNHLEDMRTLTFKLMRIRK